MEIPLRRPGEMKVAYGNGFSLMRVQWLLMWNATIPILFLHFPYVDLANPWFGDIAKLQDELLREGRLVVQPVKPGTNTEAGVLMRVTQGKGRRPPKEEVSLRDIDPIQFQVVVRGNSHPLETLDQKLAYMRLHPGAIYLNQQTSYFVEELDLTKKIAWVIPRDSRKIEYYTECREHSVLVLAGGGVARAARLPSAELMAAGKPSSPSSASGMLLESCAIVTASGSDAGESTAGLVMKCFRDCWNGLHQLHRTDNATGNPGECTWTSKEYEEYELEFQKYVSQNLQNQSPAEDFATEQWDESRQDLVFFSNFFCREASGDESDDGLREMERRSLSADVFTGGLDWISTADAEVLRGKLRQLQCLCQNANYIVVFTGAGISTSAGLPDYRGCLSAWSVCNFLIGTWTSPQGVWTRKLKGERVSDDLGLDDSWQPSLAHMAIARLHSSGIIKFVATTNVDDLHGKSGLPTDSLAELHGNSFVEECEKCLKRYKRSFVTRSATGLFEHRTGRYCQCGGPLRDIIVNFGNTFEHVPSMEDQHDAAWDGGKLVVVNLQRTPKDSLASLRIFASCDDVMAFLEPALSKGKAP
eukprot:s1451_g11.t1